MQDDTQLIEQTLSGTTEAFGELVVKYQDRLYNTLVHVVGCTDAAYDVVQDAFVQAFVKLETFHRGSTFYTWLYRIAMNLAISRRRRQRTTLSVEQTRELTGEEPHGRDESPDGQLEHKERACQVRQALAALSEEHRAVLVLREMDGCCYETIAQILDLPVGTVRSRLHRARMEMRGLLKAALQEDLK